MHPVRGDDGLWRKLDLVPLVTSAQRFEWDETPWSLGQGYGRRTEAKHHVVAIDYGVKRNILRLLARAGCKVTVVPATATAGRILWRAGRLRSKAASIGMLRGLLLFAAAVAALLLWVDPRYRDFPTLLYLAPAVVFGVTGWWRNGTTRRERTCAAIIAIGVIARWSSEPANPQAIAWLLVGLALALPPLLVRTHQDEQR